MCLSQTKEATKRFVTLFETHLGTIHPAYQRNPKVKGIRHEYFRQLEGGLLAIHSVLCMKGTYYHCFCLSLHRTPIAPFLYSPFTVGGRCDHNYTVTKACHGDLGLSSIDPVTPFRMSCSHMFRPGAERIIERCTTEAEARLLPFYQAAWRETRPALQALLDYTSVTPDAQVAVDASVYSGARHQLSCHMLEFRRLHASLPPDQRTPFFAATALTIPDVMLDIPPQLQP